MPSPSSSGSPSGCLPFRCPVPTLGTESSAHRLSLSSRGLSARAVRLERCPGARMETGTGGQAPLGRVLPSQESAVSRIPFILTPVPSSSWHLRVPLPKPPLFLHPCQLLIPPELSRPSSTHTSLATTDLAVAWQHHDHKTRHGSPHCLRAEVREKGTGFTGGQPRSVLP